MVFDPLQDKNTFPFQVYLNNLYLEHLNNQEGELASYIPELTKVNPDNFGISLVTVDGVIQKVGDTNIDFSIQSISKPFIYGLILQDLGIEGVLEKINTEPSGDAFNSISLEPITGRPLNPMINAGAIAASSCVQGKTPDERIERVLATLSRYAGRELSINQKIFQSEKRTGHRNRAIAHMLRNFNIIEHNIEPALDLYFQQCSILANSVDLAVMAATLANDGINPVTGIRVIESEFVPLILSIMSLCGMYDYSGRWIYHVGLPAKSGIGGGIIAVLPGQFGLSVYSPRIDKMGNSVRGVKVCQQFSQDFHLHFLTVPKIATSVIRLNYNLSLYRSKHMRNTKDSQLLDKVGDKCQVFELQGEIRFSGAEAAARIIYKAALDSNYILIDFKHVPEIDLGAYKLLNTLLCQIDKLKHCQYALSGANKSLLKSDLFQQVQERFFHDLDHGLEWIENQIIDKYHHAKHKKTHFSDNELFQNLSRKQIELIEENTKKVHYSKGDVIIQSGNIANEIFFLLEGEVSIHMYTDEEQKIRISTFSAGMCFGELALIGNAKRTADVIADNAVVCHILDADTLNRLSETDRNLKLLLLENLAKKIAKNLQKSNLEGIALSGLT